MIFKTGKINSLHLRYIVADEDGEMWASKNLSIRAYYPNGRGYWKMCDLDLKEFIESNYTSDPVFCHISNCPIQITWKDEPYDLLDIKE